MKIKQLIKSILPSFIIKYLRFIKIQIQCLANRKYSQYKKASYSQCGEDMIIDFLLTHTLKMKDWTWIDIGAHHPFNLSNTASFYKKGIYGINIEADPDLIKIFHRKRSKDINLNYAISSHDKGEIKFFRMNVPTLNTLLQEEAERFESVGYKIKDVISVPTMTINDVLYKYHDNLFPDVLFIDVEGSELEILKSIDYSSINMSPKIICTETISFGKKYINPYEEMIKSDITNFLISKNYLITSCTLFNTIFVHTNCYNSVR